jgi:hypothetical protein
MEADDTAIYASLHRLTILDPSTMSVPAWFPVRPYFNIAERAEVTECNRHVRNVVSTIQLLLTLRINRTNAAVTGIPKS